MSLVYFRPYSFAPLFTNFTLADKTGEWSWTIAVYIPACKLSRSRGTPCGKSQAWTVKTEAEEKGRDDL